MTRTLTPSTVAAFSALAGHALDEADASRVARAIGPALKTFGAIEGTLPFEAEPSSFTRLQIEGRDRS